MWKKNFTKNKKGFSLVEIMIAAGALAGLSLVMLNLTKMSTSSNKKFQTDMDADFITRELSGILSNPAICSAAVASGGLAGAGATTTTAGTITNINGKYFSDASAPANGYGSSNIKLTSYVISSSGYAAGETALILNFTMPKVISQTQPTLKPRIIKLIITTSGANILTCYSAWVNAQDYWTKSGNDIYYNTGKVGIGATSPSTLLTLVGNNALTFTGVSAQNQSTTIRTDSSDNAFINFGGGSGKNLSIQSNGSTVAQFSAASNGHSITGRLSLSANSASTGLAVTQSGAGYAATFMGGNVGIKTTTPTYALTVNGNIGIPNTTGTQSMYLNQTDASTWTLGNTSVGSQIRFQTSNRIYVDQPVGFGSPAALTTSDRIALRGGDQLSTSYTIRATDSLNNPLFNVSNNGYVGIGIAAPAGLLHVKGTSEMQRINFRNSSDSAGTGYGSFVFLNTNSNLEIQGSMATNDAWYIAGTGTINDGALVIGTGDDGDEPIIFKQGGTLPWPGLVAGSGGNERLRIHSNGNIGIGTTAPAFRLEVNGTIAPTGNGTTDLGASGNKFKDIYASNAVINTSDLRLKREIKTSDLGLDFINSLRPVSYFWKNGDQFLHYGVIAQEAEKAMTKAKKTSRRENEINNVIVTHDDKTDAYGVRYTELISPLIKAVQDLYLEVKTVIARVFKVEEKITINEQAIITLKMETDSKIIKLEAENAILIKENKEIKAQIQKIEKMIMKNK